MGKRSATTSIIRSTSHTIVTRSNTLLIDVAARVAREGLVLCSDRRGRLCARPAK